MTNKGNQATFLIPLPEPQGSHPLIQKYIRGRDNDRKERVAVYYDKNYGTFGLQYDPRHLGTVVQVATAPTVANLIRRLTVMGFVPMT